MATPMGSILRAAARADGEKLNVLTAPTHERNQSGMKDVNATFYMLRCPQVKDWDFRYAPLPANHVLLDPAKGDRQLPPDVDFDVVLIQNRFGQYQILSQFAKKLHLPTIVLEHTQALKEWPAEYLEGCKRMRGDLNVFISKVSAKEWGWSLEDPSVRVVHHGIDAQTFSPNDLMCDRKPTLLSVVNKWQERDVFCGFKLWQAVSKDLPVVVVGDNPGLSEPAKSVPDLVMKYRSSRVFLNTSLVSPIPMSLLEAMACGCAPVSTATSMIPEIIENGVNGFISNDPDRLRGYCHLLLRDEPLARKLGEAARKTILERFSLEKFVANWDRLLREAADITYRGF